jgi:DNA-binding GntR family transcriptional regulator
VAAVRERAVIPQILAPNLDTQFHGGDDSLYGVLSRHYGLSESVEEQTLIARVTSPTEAADLELDEGSFVIEVTGVATSANGTAFDSFQMVFVPRLFAFRLRTSPTADPLGIGD